MENRVTCLFLVGLLMVASLTESEACKKCLGAGGFGGQPLAGGGLGGHPLFGGGLGGHPMLGGGHGGQPMLGGGLGGQPGLGGFGGQAPVMYAVPYPVAVPVPMASPYSSPYASPYASPYTSLPYHEFREMEPIDGGYFEDDYIPRRRMCRCHRQGSGAHPRRRPRVYGDYY